MLTETVIYAGGGRTPVLRPLLEKGSKGKCFYFRVTPSDGDERSPELEWMWSVSFSAIVDCGNFVFGAVDFCSEQRGSSVRTAVSKWSNSSRISMFKLYSPLRFSKLLDYVAHAGYSGNVIINDKSRFRCDALLKAQSSVLDGASPDEVRFVGCQIAEDLFRSGNTMEDVFSFMPAMDRSLHSEITKRMTDLEKIVERGSRRPPLPIQGLFLSGPPGIGKSTTVKRITGVISRLYGYHSVYEKQSGGRSFFNGMLPGARLIIFDEYNPTDDCSMTELLRLVSCHDHFAFNSKGGYVSQNELVGIIIISNHSLRDLFNRLRNPIVKWEAVERRFLQVQLGTPSSEFLENSGVSSYRFTEMVAGDLLSDWICAVVRELHPAQVSFKRDWENQNVPGSDSLENRTFRKLNEDLDYCSNPALNSNSK